MTSPIRDYTLIRSRMETDAYNPVLVEDLINGLNDWRSVQEIVRLTFKALSDVVKSQGASLKELELQLPSKASKSEISSSVSLKTSFNEMSRTLSEVKSILEAKMNIDDVYSLVEEKVSKNDLQYLLGTKASYEELRGSLTEKADQREVQSELRALRAMIEEMNEENYRKFQLCAGKKDLQVLQEIVDSKVSKDEFNEAMEEKANKQSVANALHRKANKVDIDPVLNSKVEVVDFQKIVDSVQEIVNSLSLKADKTEVTKYFSQESMRKADRSEIENAMAILQSSQKDSEGKFFAYISKIESFTTALRAKLEDLQTTTVSSFSKKVDTRDFEKLTQALSKKAEIDQLGVLRSEINELVQNLRYESLKSQESFSEQHITHEKWLRSMQNELTQAHDNIRVVSENSRVTIEENIKSVHHFTGNKFEEVKQLKQEIDRIFRDLAEIKHSSIDKNEFRKGIEGKIEARDLKEFVEKNIREVARQLQSSNEELKELLLRKEKELSMLIDKKPGVHEINSLIYENVNRPIKQSIEESYKEDRSFKSSASYELIQKDIYKIRLDVDARLAAFIKEQNSLNEMLCSENCVARWLWRSGDTRNRTIPWEFESVNTCPENYLWEAGGTNIVTVSPGLYEIFYAIFTRKKPVIEVLVNGEPVFLEFSSVGKTWGRHSDGNIIAASVNDFVTLPARARISVTYNGEPGGEGVFGLRKL